MTKQTLHNDTEMARRKGEREEACQGLHANGTTEASNAAGYSSVYTIEQRVCF